MKPFPKRLKLADLPTRIEKLERFSERTGLNVYVKRDDMSGMEWSGNKIRKLEFSIQEALDRGADTLITCGGIQSNHCSCGSAAGPAFLPAAPHGRSRPALGRKLFH